MNCQRFEIVVSELARGQMMAAEQRGEALAHSDVCEDCATRLRDEEMLTRGLRSLAAEMEPFAASGEVETKLLAAFRSRQVVTPIAARQSSSRYWLAAVAAVLLIVMSVIVVRWRASAVDSPTVAEGTPQKNNDVNNKPSPEPPKDVEYQAVNEPSKRSGKKPRRAGLRRPENTQVANHAASEIATDFIPLSYMNTASLQDGGQIIRVELPRSTLANFGLPVNMDRYNQKVKADVLLGVDGMAHAIRFVQ